MCDVFRKTSDCSIICIPPLSALGYTRTMRAASEPGNDGEKDEKDEKVPTDEASNENGRADSWLLPFTFSEGPHSIVS